METSRAWDTDSPVPLPVTEFVCTVTLFPPNTSIADSELMLARWFASITASVTETSLIPIGTSAMDKPWTRTPRHAIISTSATAAPSSVTLLQSLYAANGSPFTVLFAPKLCVASCESSVPCTAIPAPMSRFASTVALMLSHR